MSSQACAPAALCALPAPRALRPIGVRRREERGDVCSGGRGQVLPGAGRRAAPSSSVVCREQNLSRNAPPTPRPDSSVHVHTARGAAPQRLLPRLGVGGGGSRGREVRLQRGAVRRCRGSARRPPGEGTAGLGLRGVRKVQSAFRRRGEHRRGEGGAFVGSTSS